MLSGQGREDDARELDALLPLSSPPAARAEFREELRRRFVQGELGPAADTPDPALAVALDSARPVARPEFKRDLRASFVAGALREEVLPLTPRSARRTSWRFRLVAVGLAAALAAAAGLLLWLALPSPSAGPWRVVPHGFAAREVFVDAERLEGLSAEQVALRLAEAGELETGESTLRLEWNDVFVLEMGPGTWLDLSGLSGDRELVLAGDRGSVRIATGPGFPGRTLVFRSPDLEARVVGTVFGIDIQPGGTCLCCLEGHVRVTSLHDMREVHDVHSRSMGFVFSQGGAAQVADSLPHAESIERLATYW